MLKSCHYCGRMHPAGFVCPQKPVRRRAVTTDQQRVRNTYRWRTVRGKVYQRDGHLCRVCLAGGRICTTDLQAHHIIPLAEDERYAYDMDWLITLCSGSDDSCHARAERDELPRAWLHRLATSPLGVPSAAGEPPDTTHPPL